MTTRPARRRTRAQNPPRAFRWLAPPPGRSTWPEVERRAVLARWDAERDRVAIEGQDAEPGSDGRQDAEGLLQHIDAIRADLMRGPVLEIRLSTLERRLAEFRRDPLRRSARRVAEKLLRHRLGYRTAPPGWQAVVLSLLRAHPRWSFNAVWDHLVQLAQRDHPILPEAILANDPRRACENVGTRPCPSGAHLHYWWGTSKTRKRLRALAAGTVRNFVSTRRPR